MASSRFAGLLRHLNSPILRTVGSIFNHCGKNLSWNIGNSIKLQLISRISSRCGRRGNIRQRVGRVLLYSGSGTLFLWDKERICDWEIDECLAEYEKKHSFLSRTVSPHHGPVSSTVSPSPPHQEEDGILSSRRIKFPRKLSTVQEQLKKIVMKFAKRSLDGSVGSVDLPRVFLLLLSFVLPPSTLFSSTAHQPSLGGLSLSRNKNEGSLSSGLFKLYKEFKQSRQSDKRGNCCFDSQPKKGEHLEPTAPEGPPHRSPAGGVSLPASSRSKMHDSVQLTEQDGNRSSGTSSTLPVVDGNQKQGAHESLQSTVCRSKDVTKETDVEKHRSKLSTSLHKVISHFGNISVDEMMMDDLIPVEEHDNEIFITHSRQYSIDEYLPSEEDWDIFLDTPLLSIKEHLRASGAPISSVGTHLANPAEHDSFVIAVGGSLFSDSFCLFDEGPSEFQLGSLCEVGHTNLTPLPAVEEDNLPDEVLLFVGSGSDTSSDASCKENDRESWILQLEKMGTKVYYRSLNGSSIYEYKVIGSFDDISGMDFAKVQIDPELRKQWDNFVLNMHVIDRDPETGSEVLHWTAKLPFPLKNRDYVFVRRTQIKRDNRVIVMLSRTTEHPQYPETSKFVRVTEFFSKMVIEAHSNIYENGFKYELIYIDNPKCTLPSSLSSWATSSGIPDYMHRIHSSALDMKKTAPKTSVLLM